MNDLDDLLEEVLSERGGVPPHPPLPRSESTGQSADDAHESSATHVAVPKGPARGQVPDVAQDPDATDQAKPNLQTHGQVVHDDHPASAIDITAPISTARQTGVDNQRPSAIPQTTPLDATRANPSPRPKQRTRGQSREDAHTGNATAGSFSKNNTRSPAGGKAMLRDDPQTGRASCEVEPDPKSGQAPVDAQRRSARKKRGQTADGPHTSGALCLMYSPRGTRCPVCGKAHTH